MDTNKDLIVTINNALAQADERQLKVIAAFVGQLVKPTEKGVHNDSRFGERLCQ
ncbi:hypothetical protein AALA61_14940 [Oscillospiraceae bacterium 42-9]